MVSDGPSPSRTNGDGAAVCRCGAGPHPKLPQRCARGHTLRGNTLALIHGNTSLQFWQEHGELVGEVRDALLADAGHADPEAAPMALRLAAAALARAAVAEAGVSGRVAELGGPLTGDGRTRRAHKVWEALYDKVMAGVRILGTERRSQPVSFHDYVSGGGDG